MNGLYGIVSCDVIDAQKHQIQLFEEKRDRTVWDGQEEKWYFSVVDAVQVLTDKFRCEAVHQEDAQP